MKSGNEILDETKNDRVLSVEAVDGELLESDAEMLAPRSKKAVSNAPKTNEKASTAARKNYLLLPLIFLTVALFGGWRFADADNGFIFLKPALVCLIFAAVLLVLFFRANLIKLDGWFSEEFSTLENMANAAVLLTLYAASVQIFNSLLPERGLPFWVVAFCFFWTLWNNLFAEFETRKLLKSLGAMFGLAFVVKYLLLANITAPVAESFWQGIWQNPTKELFTQILDLPRFSAVTGYLQFFTAIFYLIGLYLVPSVMKTDK